MQEELELDTEETNDEIEVITEETEEQSEPETQESDQEPDQAPVKKEGDDEDEIENYSESVQRRIRKLTAKYREDCLLYTSPSPRDRTRSRMPSSA